MDDPDPDSNMVIFIGIYLVLALVNYLTTMATAALAETNEKKAAALAEDGDKKAKYIVKLTDGRPRPADTKSACTAVCTSFAVISAVYAFSPILKKLELFKSQNDWMSEFLPTAIVALLATAVFVIFSSMVPRRIGSQNYEKVAFSYAGYLLFIKYLFLPFAFITSIIARGIVKVFGGDPHAEETPVTEDEILSMVDEGEETGVLEESQKEMINNIFEFGDLTVADVMTHRTDVEAVETMDELSEVIDKAIEAGCSRLPVYEDELDNIKGILYVKDLLKFVGTKIPKDLRPKDLMREALFIPESKKCRDLLSEMTEKHLQMVIVADEYGGVAGIVTVEDLIESIVGNIQDEFDAEEEEIQQISEDIFNIDGISAIGEIEELLDIEFPEGEYETVAGYLMSVLGRVPEKDEHPVVEYGGFSFTVAEMDDRRIDKLLVERLPEETDGDEQDEEK